MTTCAHCAGPLPANAIEVMQPWEIGANLLLIPAPIAFCAEECANASLVLRFPTCALVAANN